MTAQKEFKHPRFAQMYVKISYRAERLGATDRRRQLLGDARSRPPGFGMEDLRRFPLRGLPLQRASAHLIGQAHKP